MLVFRGGYWSLRLNLRSTGVLHVEEPMMGRFGAVDCFRHFRLPRTRFPTGTDLIERENIMPMALGGRASRDMINAVPVPETRSGGTFCREPSRRWHSTTPRAMGHRRLRTRFHFGLIFSRVRTRQNPSSPEIANLNECRAIEGDGAEMFRCPL